MTPAATIDHLVIAADSLAHGVQWCEATLGVTPGPGGEHPLMGTHNRLLSLTAPGYPRAYLEIISIDPAAAPPGRRRWFDLDEETVQEAIRRQPRLVHFVACTTDGAAALRALRKLGIERGPLLAAQRATPHGILSWRISVRGDGQRLFYGGLPTLIEWSDKHPADTLPGAGLALRSLQACHPRPADLKAAHAAIGLRGVTVEQGAPNLIATLDTPRGVVRLESAGT